MDRRETTTHIVSPFVHFSIVVVLAAATRVDARVRWVVCLYGGVSTCEVDDAITQDTSFSSRKVSVFASTERVNSIPNLHMTIKDTLRIGL